VTTPESVISFRQAKTGEHQDQRSPARPPRLMLAPAPFWHRAAEWMLHALAITAVIAIVLILVFIAKEAAPIFYSKEVRGEVTLAQMWCRSSGPGTTKRRRSGSRSRTFRSSALAAHPRHAQGDVVAMAVSVPLGVGAAVYVSQYAGARTREIVEAGRGAAGRHPVGRARLLRADGDGDLVPERSTSNRGSTRWCPGSRCRSRSSR
jgi:hypothetical protein